MAKYKECSAFINSLHKQGITSSAGFTGQTTQRIWVNILLNEGNQNAKSTNPASFICSFYTLTAVLKHDLNKLQGKMEQVL